MKKLCAILLAVTLLLSLAAPALAATTSGTASTLRLEKVDGTATVKNASGKAVSVRGGTRLYSGYEVATKKASYAYISLDQAKAIKLDASSTGQVAQSGKKLEVKLLSGNMFFNVTEPLKASESLQIASSTMVTGIRGTAGWVAVIDRYTTRISLLEGILTIVSTDPVTGGQSTVTIEGGQVATVVFHGMDPNAAVLPENATIEELIESGVIKDEHIILNGTGLTVEELQEEDVPGFVAIEVANDPELQKKIEETTDLSVPEIIKDAEKKQAEEEAAAEKKDGEIQDALDDLTAEEVDPLFEADTPAAGGAGGAVPTPVTPEPIQLDSPAASEVNQQLAAAAADGADVQVSGTVNPDEAINLPANQTMTLMDGATLPQGTEVNVAGTMSVAADATVNNAGTINVNSTNSLHIDGTMNNTGTINVGQTAAGKMTVSGTLTNDGTIMLGSYDTSVAGEAAVTGWLYNNNALEFASSGSVLTNSGRLYNGSSNNGQAIINMSDAGGILTNNGTLANYGTIYTPTSASNPGKLEHLSGELASYNGSEIVFPGGYDAFFIGATGAGYSEQRSGEVYALAKNPSTYAVKHLGPLSNMEEWPDNTTVTLLGSTATFGGDNMPLADFYASNVTLNLNGHTIDSTLSVESGSLTVNGSGKISSSSDPAVLVNGGSLTLNNVTVESTASGYSGQYGIVINYASTVNINNSTVTGTNAGIGNTIKSGTGVTLNITGSTISGTVSGIDCRYFTSEPDAPSSITISNSTVSGGTNRIWYTDGSDTCTAEVTMDKVPVSGNLAADDSTPTFTLTFEPNFVSTPPVPAATQTFLSGVAQSLSPSSYDCMTRSGHLFTGWNTEPDGSGTSYEPDTVVTLTKDLTLYAQWTPVVATVHFDPNDSLEYPVTGTMADFTFSGDSANILPLNTFERIGYEFLGWALTPDSGTSFEIEDGAPYPYVLYQDSTVTLYAVWRPV